MVHIYKFYTDKTQPHKKAKINLNPCQIVSASCNIKVIM